MTAVSNDNTNELSGLDLFERLLHTADEQFAWIDTNATDYEHSTRSCHTTSIYPLLGQ